MEGYTYHQGATVQFANRGYANPKLRKAPRKMNIPSCNPARMSKGLTCNTTTDLRFKKGMKAMSGCAPTLTRMQHLL